MPTSFAVSVQSPSQAIGQTIVLVGMNGSVIDSLITGGSMLGTGQAFSDSEVFRGYSSFIQGSCQGFGTLTNSVPRIVTGNGLGLSGLILPGTIGLLKFSTAGGAGLLITPRNDGGWFGIRNLTITRTSNVTLKIPAY